jgi:hypothetical protein
MGYGLRLTGQNDIYQVDSSTASTLCTGVYLKGATTGFVTGGEDNRGANFTGVTITGLADSDLVFANGSAPSAGGKRYVSCDFNSGSTTCTFDQPTNYIVLKIASHSAWNSFLGGSTADDYGIRITNDSNIVIFDSRIIEYIGGFEIRKGVPLGTLPGGVSGLDLIREEQSDNINTASYAANIFYTGNLTNQWVCMKGARSWGGVDTDYDGLLRHGFSFEYNTGSTTTGVIRYRSYSQFNFDVNPGGDVQSIGTPNSSDILLGEFRS